MSKQFFPTQNPAPVMSFTAPDGSFQTTIASIGSVSVSEGYVRCPEFVIPLNRADISYRDKSYTESHTPGWAVCLGIIGLLFFLIGIVFFFVKEKTEYPVAEWTITDMDSGVRYVSHTFGAEATPAACASIYSRLAVLRSNKAAN